MILVGNSSLPTSVYSVSQKISSISFSYNISPTENFKMNFTRLLYVHSYAKLQKIIHLSLTLTKSSHNKHDHLPNFYILLKKQKM